MRICSSESRQREEMGLEELNMRGAMRKRIESELMNALQGMYLTRDTDASCRYAYTLEGYYDDYRHIIELFDIERRKGGDPCVDPGSILRSKIEGILAVLVSVLQGDVATTAEARKELIISLHTLIVELIGDVNRKWEESAQSDD